MGRSLCGIWGEFGDFGLGSFRVWVVGCGLGEESIGFGWYVFLVLWDRGFSCLVLELIMFFWGSRTLVG